MNFAWGRDAPPPSLLAAPVLTGLAVLIPLGYLLARALQGDPAQAAEILWRSRNLGLTLNTLALVAGVLAVNTVLALPLAWATTRSNLPLRRLWVWLGVVPLAVPGYLLAYAYLGLTGSGGLLDDLLGLRLPRPQGYGGALLALSLYTTPYLFLNLRAALQSLDPALEETARSLGDSRWTAFRRVVLPALRPAFAAGGLIVALHVIGDFGVVTLMRFETLSYALYMQYAAAFDRVYAAWLAIGLLIMTGGLLWVESRMVAGRLLHRAGGGARRAMGQVSLGAWALPLMALFSLVALVGLVAPVGAILVWATEAQGMGDDLLHAVRGSVTASAPAALLVVLAALPLVYAAVRFPGRLTALLARMAFLGYATPPLALALAFIVFTLNVWTSVYQTLGLLIFAYAVHFLAEGIGPIRSQLQTVSPRIEESARALGRSRLAAFREVTFPLLRRGVLVSAAIVFLSAMKELPITFLLSPPGFVTLAGELWSYTTEAMFTEAAPFALGILVVSGAAVAVLAAGGRDVGPA